MKRWPDKLKRPAKPVWALIAIDSYVEELESYVRELEVRLRQYEMAEIPTTQEDE